MSGSDLKTEAGSALVSGDNSQAVRKEQEAELEFFAGGKPAAFHPQTYLRALSAKIDESLGRQTAEALKDVLGKVISR